jgi:putative ABC transport system substrate-binding protein
VQTLGAIVSSANWGKLMKPAVSRHRREFLLSTCALLSASSLNGQPSAQMRLVGVFLGTTSDRLGQAYLSALRDTLDRAGWKEGRNIEIDARWGEGDPDRIRAQADSLAARKPDVIAVHTATALREIRRATKEIPIVFWGVSDPLGNKFVSNLARPGGNISGFSLFEYDMGPKWLQLLKEVAPQIRRVLVLMHANNPNLPGWVRAIEPSGPSLSLRVTAPHISDGAQIETTISAFAREPLGSLLVLPDPQLAPLRDTIIRLAADFKLPAIYGLSEFTERGGLMSYSIDQVDLATRAAVYVSRILNREKVGELPIQLPTKFELAINTKTARTLGLELPRTLVVRADRLIQ